MEYLRPEQAVGFVRSGDRVYVHGMAAAPSQLLKALANRHEELKDVEIIHLHIEGPAPHVAEGMQGSFHHTALFVGRNTREAVNDGRADYVPVFLSEVPTLLQSAQPVNVVLIHVSPPDRHGFCSLGVSVEATVSAIRKADTVIAQVNPKMPRTHGDGFIHESAITAAVWVEDDIPELHTTAPSEVECRIGMYVSELIEDGSTLQMGIGAIPNAVLQFVQDRRNLGIHSEMISDGIVDLFKSGAVNNRLKRTDCGLAVATFILGSRKVYDFVDDNPQVILRDVEYVNNPEVIRQNPKVVAINSAIEVDLTGQVCADSIGPTVYSGVGGQMDFIRGAALSAGGKPVIALPSRTHSGQPRIVSTLRPGAGVVTSRAHVHWVVTEFGRANLYGKSLRERAKALIQLAHPEDRDDLELVMSRTL